MRGFPRVDTVERMGDAELSPLSLLSAGLEDGDRRGSRGCRQLAERMLGESTPPPFAELVAPLAQSAERMVNDRFGQLGGQSGRNPDLPVQELVKELLRVVGPVLVDHWRRFPGPPGADVAGRYAAVSAELSRGRFEQILVRRPDIAALVAERLAAWAGGLLEVMVRAREDQAALGALLGVPTGLGPPERVLPVGGDTHGGRRALLLVFADGQVIHKPRDLRVDALVGLLARAAQLDVRVPRMLVRDGWGWSARVPASPCASLDEVARYYRGAGHLLALAQTLGLRDLHAENLVAAGAHVVCVDMEVCFVFDDGLGADGQFRLSDTALLPADREDDVEDISGLGRPPAISGRPTTTVGWSARGTPELQELRQTATHVAHIPHTARGFADPLAFADAVESGYLEGVHAVRSHRTSLSRLLADVADFGIRHVLRPTREYAKALDRALLDERVTDPRSRARFFARLYADTPAPWRPLVRGEIKALVRGEIPRIAGTAGSRTLSCEGEDAHDLLPSPGVEQALRRLHGPWRRRSEDARREIRAAMGRQERQA
jgi:hypothetical protein